MFSTGKIITESLLTAVILLVGAVVYYLCGNGEEVARAHLLQQRPGTSEPVTQDREHFLNHDGRRRRYLVHVPKGYDGTRPLPVVLGFHGGGGRSETFRNLCRLNAVADRRGFLVVYPDGTGRGKQLTFNAGHCCGFASQEKVDDVGFVRKLLDDLPTHYSVDPQRVYATGMSNGAMLCYRLATDLSDRIAAIAPVAAAMQNDGTPPRPMPIIHFHGLKDPYAYFAGGKEPLTGVVHRPVADTIAFWIKVNHCRKEPVEVKEEKDYTRKRYLPAPGTQGAPVVLYSLPEGGHTWPGGGTISPLLGCGKTIHSVDASSLMWDFFEPFTLPGAKAKRPE